MPSRLGSATLARRIGVRIRALRQEAKVTQERLAWDCDLDKGYLSQVEAGKRVPSVPVLVAIARRLRLEPADLLCFPGSRPRLRLLEAARKGDRKGVEDALRQLACSRG